MKKSFLFLAAAALALASCNNDVKVAENQTLANEPQEIAIFPLAQKPMRAPGIARAAVEGAAFPISTAMMVTAYNATAGEDFFDATEFAYGTSTWKGSKYWPFTPATINFLAIANANSDNATGVTWGPLVSDNDTPENPDDDTYMNKTEGVEIVMSDNSSSQRDLMYACGTGTVSQSSNTLSFPTNVPMEFKHAQAWVKFYVQAANETSEAITINYIQLNSVSCRGTYRVTHANWDETLASRTAAGDGSKDGSVSGVWSNYSTYATNIAAVKDAGFIALDYDAAELPQYYGSLMVVPNQGMASFTINYTIDGNTYDYTYTPASTSLSQAYKYTYNITLTLHEIEIAPTVANWTEGGPTAVSM